MDSTQFIQLQICILMAVGLWPIYWKPFQETRVKQILLASYSCVWVLLYAADFVTLLVETVTQGMLTSYGSILLQQMSYVANFLTKVSIWYTSFKFSCLWNHLQCVRTKQTVWMIVWSSVPTVIMLICSSYSSIFYARFSDSMIGENPSLVNKLAHYMHISAAFVVWTESIPGVILMGFGILIKNYHEECFHEIFLSTNRKENLSNSKVVEFREKFEQLSDCITTINSTFKHYTVSSSICVGWNIAHGIYLNTVMCSDVFPLEAYILQLIFFSINFLVLCVGGQMISSTVSIFQ